MKNNLQTNPLLFKMVLLVTCFMLVILYNKSKAAVVTPVSPTSGTRVVVNFKHNIEKNELTIRIKSGTEAIMQLFIFSPDGILIKEVAVCAKKITTIKGLKKGYYLYECFDKDERMKSGSLIIN